MHRRKRRENEFQEMKAFRLPNARLSRKACRSGIFRGALPTFAESRNRYCRPRRYHRSYFPFFFVLLIVRSDKKYGLCKREDTYLSRELAAKDYHRSGLKNFPRDG